MPRSSTYSASADLLIGDLIVSTTLKDKHVTDASDEIDAKLGFIYTVPFVESAVSAPAWILIRRIANNLASGRLLLEVNQSREPAAVGYQQQPVKVVSYGQSLIDEAEHALDLILQGDIPLTPVTPDPTGAPVLHGARVGNADGYSQVEAFYGWASKPVVTPQGWPLLPGGWIQ